MSLDNAGLRVLTKAECLHRLATVSVGPIALSHRALPMILPVHYRMEDDLIVMHTTLGTTLHRATDRAVVAFEAEGPAGTVEPRWSVVVHGVATHPADGSRISDPCVARIELAADEVTGREALDDRDPMGPIFSAARGRW